MFFPISTKNILDTAFAFPRIIDCQAARMNGIKCGFLDRAH